MMEPFGPRVIVPSGPAASLPAMQAGEKVVHRPEKKLLPAERVERTAQTGPRPAFQQTYLEQMAAFWPEEPEPPASQVDYDAAGDGAAPSPAPPTENGFAAVRFEDLTAEPLVDIRT
jgi:hypothetical protein